MTGGGDNTFSVFLTGTEENVPAYSSSSSSTSTDGQTSTSAEQPHVITQAGQTIVVTAQSQTDAADNSSSSGANTAGIAAGVVVGVVGLASLMGGAFFFYRYKKRKAIENEYRRNADINNFVAGGGKPMSSSSMSDSRFDGDFMAQRRQSNGSIADDQDFSRRILKVGLFSAYLLVLFVVADRSARSPTRMECKLGDNSIAQCLSSKERKVFSLSRIPSMSLSPFSRLAFRSIFRDTPLIVENDTLPLHMFLPSLIYLNRILRSVLGLS